MQNWLVGLGEWRVSDNAFYLDFGDVKSEWIFIPLENAEDQARLLSMQLTGAFISEIIECNFDILAPISGRIGRYPSGNRGTPSWWGILADTNMPVELSDWAKFMIEPPADWQIFIQPSGMSDKAENLNYLPQNEFTKDTIAEETSFDEWKRLGLPAFPAPTNDIDTRLRAVETLLGRQVNGGPALCINGPGCPWLVRAMSGGYRYKKHRDGGLRSVPE